MMRFPYVLLFSGGLDSTIAYHLLAKPPLLYVKIGHAYQAAELNTISLLQNANAVGHVMEVEGANIGSEEEADGHIPYRNLHLATVAAFFGRTVYFGALRGESSKDKSARFYRQVSRLLSYLEDEPIKVIAPFRHLTKKQLVATYLEKGGDPEILKLTRSCYAAHLPAGFIGCGQCMACFRRWVAMSLNGIDEPHLRDPSQWKAVQRENWQEWMPYLVGANPMEWGGIALNNLDAYHALTQRRR
jgi:7-cyano-7-deazaguanine synthase in queuosine biosynthesis